MPFVPLTAFAPDQPQIVVQASNNIINVLPATEASYGPFPSLQAYSSGIQSRCQGGIALQDTAGNVSVFAGDIANLYRLASGSLAPAIVSDASGYSTGSNERWSFALFGLTVCATNYTNEPAGYTEGTSSLFAQLIQTGSTTLKARYVATVRDWLVFGNTNDDTFGVKPQRIWWSAINDPTDFPIPGTSDAAAKLSDYQDIVGDHGWCMGIVGNLGGADAAILMERAVWRMTQAGPPKIFDIVPLEGARGCPAPGSVVQHGSLFYYLSDEGFMKCDGASSDPIGRNKVDRFFYKEVDTGQLYRVTAAVDPVTGIVFWAYPTNGATSCNRILAYNPSIDRWSVTATGAVEVEILLRSLSFGYTIDSMDSLFPDADLVDISGDSRAWTGGRLLLSAFDTSHRLANFNGTPLAATVETQEANIFSGKRGLVTEVRPIIDGSTASVSIGSRDNPAKPVVFGQPAPMQEGGQCLVLSAGRYQKARITVPASIGWEHISGIEITKAAPLGSR